MRKAWIVAAVAAGFMGTMSLAQAGAPAAHPAETSASEAAGGHQAQTAPSNRDQSQSPSTNTGQGTASAPTVPGARVAQSAALGDGAEMAIVGGALLAAGVAAFASHSGSGNASTPGTGGTTGSTGTTGTQ